MNQLCMISVVRHIKFKEIKIIMVFSGHWINNRQTMAPDLILVGKAWKTTTTTAPPGG